MKHSDQGITKTERGEEQPTDKERVPSQTSSGGSSPAHPKCALPDQKGLRNS
jgi:hypothetical protein